MRPIDSFDGEQPSRNAAFLQPLSLSSQQELDNLRARRMALKQELSTGGANLQQVTRLSEHAAAIRRNAQIKWHLQGLSKGQQATAAAVQQKAEFLMAKHSYLSAARKQLSTYLREYEAHVLQRAQAEAAEKEAIRRQALLLQLASKQAASMPQELGPGPPSHGTNTQQVQTPATLQQPMDTHSGPSKPGSMEQQEASKPGAPVPRAGATSEGHSGHGTQGSGDGVPAWQQITLPDGRLALVQPPPCQSLPVSTSPPPPPPWSPLPYAYPPSPPSPYHPAAAHMAPPPWLWSPPGMMPVHAAAAPPPSSYPGMPPLPPYLNPSLAPHPAASPSSPPELSATTQQATGMPLYPGTYPAGSPMPYPYAMHPMHVSHSQVPGSPWSSPWPGYYPPPSPPPHQQHPSSPDVSHLHRQGSSSGRGAGTPERASAPARAVPDNSTGGARGGGHPATGAHHHQHHQQAASGRSSIEDLMDPSPLRGSTNTHLGGSHVLDPAINLGSISSGTGLPPGVSAYQSREGSKLSNVSTDQVQATGSMQQGDQVRVQAGQLVSGSTAAGGPAPMTDQQRDMVGRGLKVIQEEGEGDSSGQGNSSASSGRGSANGTGSGSGSSNIVRTTSGKAPLLMPILAGLAHPHGPGLAADDGDDGSGKIVPESEDTPRAHRPMRSGPPGTSPAVLQLGSAGDSPPQGHPQQQGPGTWTTSPSPTRPSPLGIQRIPSFETLQGSHIHAAEDGVSPAAAHDHQHQGSKDSSRATSMAGTMSSVAGSPGGGSGGASGSGLLARIHAHIQGGSPPPHTTSPPPHRSSSGGSSSGAAGQGAWGHVQRQGAGGVGGRVMDDDAISIGSTIQKGSHAKTGHAKAAFGSPQQNEEQNQGRTSTAEDATSADAVPDVKPGPHPLPLPSHLILDLGGGMGRTRSEGSGDASLLSPASGGHTPSGADPLDRTPLPSPYPSETPRDVLGGGSFGTSTEQDTGGAGRGADDSIYTSSDWPTSASMGPESLRASESPSKRAILLRHDPEAAGFSHPRYLLRDDSLHRPDTGSEVQDVFDKVLEGIPEAEAEAGVGRSTPAFGAQPSEQQQHTLTHHEAEAAGDDDHPASSYHRASSGYLSGPPALGRGSSPLVPVGGHQEELGSPPASKEVPLALTPPRAVSLSHSVVPALQAAAAEEAAALAVPAVRDEVADGLEQAAIQLEQSLQKSKSSAAATRSFNKPALLGSLLVGLDTGPGSATPSVAAGASSATSAANSPRARSTVSGGKLSPSLTSPRDSGAAKALATGWAGTHLPPSLVASSTPPGPGSVADTLDGGSQPASRSHSTLSAPPAGSASANVNRTVLIGGGGGGASSFSAAGASSRAAGAGGARSGSFGGGALSGSGYTGSGPLGLPPRRVSNSSMHNLPAGGSTAGDTSLARRSSTRSGAGALSAAPSFAGKERGVSQIIKKVLTADNDFDDDDEDDDEFDEGGLVGGPPGGVGALGTSAGDSEFSYSRGGDSLHLSAGYRGDTSGEIGGGPRHGPGGAASSKPRLMTVGGGQVRMSGSGAASGLAHRLSGGGGGQPSLAAGEVGQGASRGVSLQRVSPGVGAAGAATKRPSSLGAGSRSMPVHRGAISGSSSFDFD